MKGIVIALVIMLAVAQTDQDWLDWKEKYEKTYASPEEEAIRRGYWETAFRTVAAQNALDLGYVAGLNAMSDYSPEELEVLRGAHYDPDQEPGTSYSSVNGETPVGAALPASLDWRNVNAITSVKNQANCGCCWAFSSTAYIESIAIIKNNRTYDLSEEFLLECTASSDCGGGYVSKAMNLSLSGMPNDTTYPYLAANWGVSGRPSHGICGSTSLNSIPTATVAIYNNVTDTQLKTMLTNGPIPVLIAADTNFQNYVSGTFTCSGTASMTINDLNHAVQLIGYDANGNYLIKNSWGVTWGVNGFATVSSTLDCGIKQVVYEFVSTLPNVITYNGTVTNNTTNNSTTNKVKFEWKMTLMFALAVFSMLIMA